MTTIATRSVPDDEPSLLSPGGSLVVTKLLTRPRTASASVPRATLPKLQGLQCSVTPLKNQGLESGHNPTRDRLKSASALGSAIREGKGRVISGKSRGHLERASTSLGFSLSFLNDKGIVDSLEKTSSSPDDQEEIRVSSPAQNTSRPNSELRYSNTTLVFTPRPAISRKGSVSEPRPGPLKVVSDPLILVNRPHSTSPSFVNQYRLRPKTAGGIAGKLQNKPILKRTESVTDAHAQNKSGTLDGLEKAEHREDSTVKTNGSANIASKEKLEDCKIHSQDGKDVVTKDKRVVFEDTPSPSESAEVRTSSVSDDVKDSLEIEPQLSQSHTSCIEQRRNSMGTGSSSAAKVKETVQAATADTPNPVKETSLVKTSDTSGVSNGVRCGSLLQQETETKSEASAATLGSKTTDQSDNVNKLPVKNEHFSPRSTSFSTQLRGSDDSTTKPDGVSSCASDAHKNKVGGKAERESLVPSLKASSEPSRDFGPKVYRMAKVEMYEKYSTRQPRLSIAEEIRKQNLLLEERNSEHRLTEQLSAREKFQQSLTEKDGQTGDGSKHEDISTRKEKDEKNKVVRTMKREGSFADRGNICGSPGFKFIHDQLKSLNGKSPFSGTRKLGTSLKTTQEFGKSLQENNPLKLSHDNREFRLSGLRPLTEYMQKPSQENLFVAGGAYTYKSGEQAVSSAAESMASPAVIPAKVSVQDPAKKAPSEGWSGDPRNPSNNPRVRVSLSFLKEKNGINGMNFRHRMDGYLESSTVLEGTAAEDPKKASGIVGQTVESVHISASGNKRPASFPGNALQGRKSKVTLNDNQRGLASAKAETTHTRPSVSSSKDVDERENVDAEDSGSEMHDSQPGSAASLTSSSSTPTAAFSGSELLYGGADGLHRTPPHADDLSGSDMAGYEKDRQRLRDLDIGNKRPPSRGKRASYSVVEKVSFDRDRDDVRTLNNSLPAKNPTLRSNGIRNNLVRGEQLLAHRNSTSNLGREQPDDLIAMGTIWSPANATNNNNNNNNNNNASNNGSSSGPTRSSSNTTASNKSANNNNNNNNGSNNGTNGVPQRKPVSVNIPASSRLGHSSSFGGTGNSGLARQLSNRENKEVEPKYPDPLPGAPASFQQRLMELASLEAETIRWERTKKVKKKPKQDRDS